MGTSRNSCVKNLVPLRRHWHRSMCTQLGELTELLEISFLGSSDSPLDWLTSGCCSQQLTESKMLACYVLLHMGTSTCRRPSHPQASSQDSLHPSGKKTTPAAREKVRADPGNLLPVSRSGEGLYRPWVSSASLQD